MPKSARALIWVAVSLLGAAAFAIIALKRNETVNAAWLLTAAVCTYAVAYRFYSKMIASNIFALNTQRLTPAVRLNNGRDYVPTNRWIVFGQHFAAIAGPGPLVGPTLAAQFGFLPGVLWLIIGVVLAGAVQDFVILASSIRRDGKSLGQMAKDEIGDVAGYTALFSVLAIMIVIIAVLAFVIVGVLNGSPWGTSTIAFTIPIAMLMGLYLRFVRPSGVLEASLAGLVLLVVAVYGGRWVAESPTMAPWFTLSSRGLALTLIIYGFVTTVLPMWLLLAPRGYLSAFVKLGVVFALAIGIIIVLPDLQMPAVTKYIDGTGPVFAGKLFPFVFITIACGAVSGFHALVSSGTTPKLIDNEMDARPVAYGGMLLESLVGVMALIAACVLTPGVYFAINSPVALLGSTPETAAAAINSWGFVVTPAELTTLAQSVGESSLLSRVGGAPSLAVGMAHLFSNVLGGTGAMALWYHFAVMFEALFILTTIDAGTRVGRFMLQDFVGKIWEPFGRKAWYPATVMSSGVFVAMWGYLLWGGVNDPNGGIRSLWPLFGISNQLLAAVALCIATTIIIKMGKGKLAWVTILPLSWLVIVTMTAGYQKLFSPLPSLGFLAHANAFKAAMAAGTIPAGAGGSMAVAQQLVRNDYLNSAVDAVFMLSVIVILIASIREWIQVMGGKKAAISTEVPFSVASAPLSGRPAAASVRA